MKPRIGIRPVIDGRCLGIRESLEAQTMGMANAAKKLIEENCFYADGSPVECVIADSTIGGGAEAAAAAPDGSGRRHGAWSDAAATAPPGGTPRR